MHLVVTVDEPLEKKVGHKYLRRIPSKRPGRKWDYIYGRESVRHQEAVQVGEKIRITHEGQAGHYEVSAVHGEYATLRHDETGHEVSIRKDHLLQLFKDEHQLAVKPRWQEKRATREKRVAEAGRLATEAKKVEKWAGEVGTAEAYRIAVKAHKAAADAGVDEAVWHRAKSFDLQRAAAAVGVREAQRRRDESTERSSGVVPDKLKVPFERMGKEKFKREMGRRRAEGLILTGRTYDWKEQIKEAGGVWDRYDKCWLMPSAEHVSWFRDRMNRGIQPGAMARSKTSAPSTELELRKLTPPARPKAKRKLPSERPSDEYLLKIENLLESVISSGKWEGTLSSKYASEKEMKIQKVYDGWTMEELNTLEADLKGMALEEPKPKTEWSLGGGSGYGHRGYTVGQTLRASDHLRKKGYPEFVTVTKASKTYFREDGLSFGVGDDQGHYYSATVRAATDEEAAAVREKIDAAERKRTLQREVTEIADDIRKHGEFPRPEEGKLVVATGDRMFDSQNIYGGGSWFLVTPDHVWFVRNNGADGDNWSYNNVRTGGAGATGWRVPRTDELVAKLKKAQAELGPKASV